MKLQTVKSSVQFILAIFSVAALFVVFSTVTHAQQPPVGIPTNIDLDGYLWSSTIGWISLNCKTGGTSGSNVCGTSSYKVTLLTNGNLSGFAWSSNVGWVKFDGLSSFPSGAGTVSVSARVSGTYPNLTFEGWARACSGTATGNCSSMVSRADGWDGWISLKGTGYSIVTTASGINNGSFAWGSTVMGWVNFDQALLALPTATLTAGNCTIPDGGSTCNALFTWNIPVAIPNPSLYRASAPVTVYTSSRAGTNFAYPLHEGINTVQVRSAGLVLITVNPRASCVVGSSFIAGTCQKPIAPAPVISITTMSKLVRMGGTTEITWTTSPDPVESGTCTIYGPGFSGVKTGSGSQLSGAVKSKTTFLIKCSGPYGTVEASDTVEVVPGVQEI